MTTWSGTRVLVTGGAGFLGKALVPRLEAVGAHVFVPRKQLFDLRDPHHVREVYQEAAPSIVIHAAAHGGGIGYMQQHPAEVYYDNIMMNTLIIQAAYEHGVEKFIGVGTVCSYPKVTPVPFQEEDLWNGYPEETNGAYGLAKKMMSVQLEAYKKQYRFQGITLLLANLYGPGDNFDPEASHVIPALIRKFLTAKKNGAHTVTLWGSGEATREFLFVEDAAKGIVLAADHNHGSEPFNLGTGTEVSLEALVSFIQELTGYKGEIMWDTSKPDGQPRRCLDVRKAEKRFGFRAETSLREGLQKTIAWYQAMECSNTLSAEG